MNRLVKEYAPTKIKTGTDKMAGHGLFRVRNIRVDARKPIEQVSVKSQTEAVLRRAWGKCRSAVRGLLASYFRSTSRLKAIAALRAKTMHRTIPPSSIQENSFFPFQAKAALSSAKGSANTVWLKRIISNKLRITFSTFIPFAEGCAKHFESNLGWSAADIPGPGADT